MRKKGMAILLCSALLTLGAACTSYAAGWVQEGNNWTYQDNNGNKVKNGWAKGTADGLWRYLDANGNMAINCWVDDDTYYVDQNGIMATDKWLKVSADNYGNYKWYYLGSTGRMISEAWKKISDRYYYFDDEGVMQTGWLEDGDNIYYLGSDGAMRTGWQNVVPYDEDEDEDDGGPVFDDSGDKKWFYFDSKGRLYKPDDDYGEKKINNTWYCFNNNGEMQIGWVALDGNVTDISGYKYYAENGVRQTGWQLLYPPEDVDGTSYDEEQYYYFENDGSPKVGPQEGSGREEDLVRISGITYLFNDYGNPIQGLQRVQMKNDSGYTAYYFGDKATSSVVTGKKTLEEGDGSDSVFYFAETGSYKGRGYNGVHDGYLYYMGRLQKADSSARYEAFSIPTEDGYTTYVVNTSGKVQKKRTIKDSDGNKFETNSAGVLQKINEETFEGGNYKEPIAPVFPNE